MSHINQLTMVSILNLEQPKGFFFKKILKLKKKRSRGTKIQKSKELQGLGEELDPLFTTNNKQILNIYLIYLVNHFFHP